jgi:hypothetical protein
MLHELDSFLTALLTLLDFFVFWVAFSQVLWLVKESVITKEFLDLVIIFALNHLSHLRDRIGLSSDFKSNQRASQVDLLKLLEWCLLRTLKYWVIDRNQHILLRLVLLLKLSIAFFEPFECLFSTAV